MLEFDHTALISKDIPADIAWYRSLYPNLAIMYQDETWALLDIGGSKIALVTKGQHPYHTALKVSSRSELDELSARYNAPIVEHRDRSLSFYTKDPSGNAVEIVYYP
jgi:catechol-2,3-dioxygenase